ncbi:hypothetical protein [Tenacibaculum sp. C7A-26P2]|uniref:hypothetical protein n=1 Tax=Tenacibaculum sp. C7A-26P2 TaxID=3447504 RepID=UPI003F8711C4
MKNALLILSCLINLGCKQETRKNTFKIEIDSSSKQEVVHKKSRQVEKVKEEEIVKNEKLFDPKSLDTLLYFKDSLLVSLKNTDSLYIPDHYFESKFLDSLIAINDNDYEKELEIEKYLLKLNEDYAKRDSLGLHLKIKNGGWKLISSNVDVYQLNIFEYYFEKYGFYAIRTQWGEGNGYKLINENDGKELNLFGRPYFSNKGNYLISVSVDIEAGYSRNGFQLFKNNNGNLKEIGFYEPVGWGPSVAKWVNDSTVIFKNETVEFKDGLMNNIYFYSKLNINNID